MKNNLLTLIFVGFFASTLAAQSREGDRLYDEKNYREAEEAYLKENSSATASYNAGNAAYQLGEYAKAAERYKKAAELASAPVAKSDAFFNLGNAYLREGKYAEAVAAYEKSLRLSPNRADAQKNLQIAKKKMEQDDPPPPPPPPPPPSPKPQRRYLDRAEQLPKIEQISGGLTPEAARQLLQNTIAREEQKSARQYRQLALPTRASRLKKDW